MRKVKVLQVKDLPEPREATDAGGMLILARQPVLYCHSCREHWSANPGDYWASEHDLICGGCDEPLVLAETYQTHVPLGQREAVTRFVQQLWEAAEAEEGGNV